jgi:hypothetical protein
VLYVTGEIEIVILFHQGPLWLRYSNEREITPAINNNRDKVCNIIYNVKLSPFFFTSTGIELISLVKYLL